MEMNKAEWDAMDAREKDQVVWDHFQGIEPDSDDWVLSRDGGESGFDFFETEEEANSGLLTYEGTDMFEGATVVHWQHCLDFTTDRNACALVLDEIEKRSLWREFTKEFMSATPIIFYDDFVADAIPKILRATSDTICYCAVKAVEDERSADV